MQKILTIDDEPSVRQSYQAILEGRFSVSAAATVDEGLAMIDAQYFDLILLDLMMPGRSGNDMLEILQERADDTPVVVVSGISSVETAVEAMRRGAREFVLKPFDVDQLFSTIERILSEDRRDRELSTLREEKAFRFDGLVGASPAFNNIVGHARKAALSDATVLVTGESGTGKDMMARAIHTAGRRSDGPFVHVSCCALPEQLVESELFGHVRGAFTGATDKRTGKVKVADGGTLFLDEIGEMPLATQAKFLQLLQDSRFTPVGSDKTIEADVRFVCATNRNLQEAVAAGTFRQDLYYRINVVHLEMPPLRQRREDIAPLVNHFMEKHRQRSASCVTSFAPDAMTALATYDWPGNIRELENIMQRLLVLHADEKVLRAEHVNPMTGATADPSAGSISDFDGLPLQDAIAQLERHLIERALERAGNVQSQAAELLGTTRRILKYKMDQLGIDSAPETGQDPRAEVG